MYLEKFPLLTYTFNNTDYSLVDIFRRVTFKQSTLENISAFFTYYVTDDDTPENIATNFYGDSSLWWLVLLPNNIISNNEFPISENYLIKLIENQYPGKILFFNEYMPDLKSGDILAGVTLNAEETAVVETSESDYAVIKDYNKTFRYVVVNDINGTLEANDKVGFYNKDSVELNHDYILTFGGNNKLKSWATIRRVMTEKEAPIEFQDANYNFVSPYKVNSSYDASSTAIGIYNNDDDLSDVETINNTSLYKFMLSLNDSNVSFIKSNQSQLIRDNEKYRSIKLLNPKFVSLVVNEIISLLNSNNKTISITVNT